MSSIKLRVSISKWGIKFCPPMWPLLKWQLQIDWRIMWSWPFCSDIHSSAGIYYTRVIQKEGPKDDNIYFVCPLHIEVIAAESESRVLVSASLDYSAWLLMCGVSFWLDRVNFFSSWKKKYWQNTSKWVIRSWRLDFNKVCQDVSVANICIINFDWK